MGRSSVPHCTHYCIDSFTGVSMVGRYVSSLAISPGDYIVSKVASAPTNLLQNALMMFIIFLGGKPQDASNALC